MKSLYSHKIATLLFPLGALFLLEFVTLLGILDMNTPKQGSLSEMVASYEGGSIDDGAVMVVAESDVVRAIALCSSLPQNVWVLLLIIGVLLVLFNFREQYRTFGGIVYWKFETFLVAFFLMEWWVFDGCREATWFPLALIKCVLISFLIFQVKSMFGTSTRTEEGPKD
jgi:hypothetical protein